MLFKLGKHFTCKYCAGQIYSKKYFFIFSVNDEGLGLTRYSATSFFLNIRRDGIGGFVYRAAAPEIISMSSPVMTACLDLL